jgi:hypothetical protein
MCSDGGMRNHGGKVKNVRFYSEVCTYMLSGQCPTTSKIDTFPLRVNAPGAWRLSRLDFSWIWYQKRVARRKLVSKV